jgi:hypothetical protein
MDAGYSMSEVHIYAGCGKYPLMRNGRETIAPGQYTFNPKGKERTVEYTASFTNVNGPIWVIAHAVVCNISGTLIDSGSYTKKIDCRQSASQGTQGPGNNNPGRGKWDMNDFLKLPGMNIDVYPNPFRSQTQITFGVEEDTHAVVEVYTLQGSKVATLFEGAVRSQDIYSVTFTSDGQVKRQVYFVVFRTGYGKTRGRS